MTRPFLRPEEVAAVLDYHKRHKRYKTTRRNLIVFRLAACCGLRRKEIAGLDMRDVLTVGPQPVVMVRAAITKGRDGERKNRLVPLDWDKQTLTDLAAWKACRLKMGAQPSDPFVCVMKTGIAGKRLIPACLASHWKSAIGVLGPDRVRQLSIHCGRHTFCTLALFGGRSLVEVQRAAGHSGPQMTGEYLHLIRTENVPDIFDF